MKRHESRHVSAMLFEEHILVNNDFFHVIAIAGQEFITTGEMIIY